jgi:hypothetical protein
MLVVQMLVAFVAFTFTAMLFFAMRRAARAARSRARRAPQPGQSPTTRRPLQVVAADLRRLSRQIALVPSGSPLVRWQALWAAYDGVLVEAAEMLGVEHELSGQPAVGVGRDVERVRVLAALEGAGLVVRG